MPYVSALTTSFNLFVGNLHDDAIECVQRIADEQRGRAKLGNYHVRARLSAENSCSTN